MIPLTQSFESLGQVLLNSGSSKNTNVYAWVTEQPETVHLIQWDPNNNYLHSRNFVSYSSHDFNNRTFEDQTHILDLNTRQVHYLILDQNSGIEVPDTLPKLYLSEYQTLVTSFQMVSYCCSGWDWFNNTMIFVTSYLQVTFASQNTIAFIYSAVCSDRNGLFYFSGFNIFASWNSAIHCVVSEL